MLKTLAAAAAVLAVTTSPNVKKLGNAITEYRDPAMQTIVAYEYSHRYHDDRWLMIDAGTPTITKLRQNAIVWKRELRTYFQGDQAASSYRLFALPGEGVVSGNIVTDMYGPTLVTLYFESPDQWKEGSYTLTIDNGKARADLPIELK